MNTDRIKQILGVDKSKKSVNTDIHLKVNIENKERLLPPDEITHIVNVGDRFNINPFLVSQIVKDNKVNFIEY